MARKEAEIFSGLENGRVRLDAFKSKGAMNDKNRKSLVKLVKGVIYGGANRQFELSMSRRKLILKISAANPNDSCVLHPKYQVKRAPRANCVNCQNLWEKKQAASTTVV